MVQFLSWTGYPFLSNPVLLLRQFRAGDRKILKMLFYHFYPGLCLFANLFIRDEAAAKVIAGKSLEKLWIGRSGIESLEAIKVYLYVDTYQHCSQFMKTVQKDEESVKSPLGGDPISEEEVMAAVVYAEILSSIEEMPGAPEWLSSRLQRQPAGQILQPVRNADPPPAPDIDERPASPI